MITSGQKEHEIGLIVAAARKAGEEAIEELSKNGAINRANFQRALAQGNKLRIAIKTVVKTTIIELAENVVDRLKRLYPNSTIELGATNGKETIAEATDVFTAGIYYAKKRGPSKVMPKTAVNVYEMIKDETCSQVFGGFGENLKRLCWTESQIVALCRDHRDLLRKDGYGTFFLFSGKNCEFLVARVYVCVGGQLHVYVHPLDNDRVWYAESRHRIMVPQL